MNEITKEWVDKTENDFDAADLTLHGREMPIVDAVCFHSQQCAEKYLKAFLQEHRIRFERRHELNVLLDLCVPLDGEFETLRDTLQSLEHYAVLIRYPGLIVPVEMAEQAFSAAEK
jgi:HEPN domain-containing protein